MADGFFSRRPLFFQPPELAFEFIPTRCYGPPLSSPNSSTRETPEGGYLFVVVRSRSGKSRRVCPRLRHAGIIGVIEWHCRK